MDILDVKSSLNFSSGGKTEIIPFIGKGNIWIENTYDSNAVKLARYLIMEAIEGTSPGQISILGYDSDLSGVFAPFAELSSGEIRQMELISEEKDFKERLLILYQQIQAVQNVIQGREDYLIDYRRSINRPVESYKLVVLSLDMGILDNETRAELSLLLRRGPSAGISFLIISTTYMSIQTSSGKDIELKVESLAQNITVLQPEKTSFVILNSGSRVNYSPPDAKTIISSNSKMVESFKNAKLPTVLFNELHDLTHFWNESSIDGVTFSVGKYGINNVEIVMGDEVNQRHNAIITGAVGQGKSNLISVIIHSLCMRYSPKELSLYLLDFKEGVTFKAFSNIGQDEYLPHAKTLGLESDVSFGIAVMDYLYKEYQRRMKLLKKYNVKSLREYRKLYPESEMPRIVVVIDEFQMMFGDDNQTAIKIADMLEKSVRLFRAAGIHFILASQTLTGNMALSQKGDSIFSQIPIRIALKNSVAESTKTLSLNNTAAAFLRPREAIVNLDYGAVTQNRKSVVAFADEKVLVPIRKKWWENAKSYTKPPYVFEGEKRVTVSNGIDTLEKLRKESPIKYALAGDKISIDGARVLLPMTDEPGRNVAIIGTPDNEINNATGMMQSIAVSLAVQHPKGDARFIFSDFSTGKEYTELYPGFSDLMEQMGFYIECVSREEFGNYIEEIKSNISDKEKIYIFGSNMDRWEYEKDPYGQGSPLKDLVENYSSKGVHFIGWWIKAANFTEQTSGYGSSDAFNSKIFLRIDERSVQSLTNPFVKWTATDNRALLSDPIENSEEMVFIPYSPISDNDVSEFRMKVWE